MAEMTRPRSMTMREERLENEAIEAWFGDQPQDAQQCIIRQIEYMCGYEVRWRDGQLTAKSGGHSRKVWDPDLPGASIRGLGLRGALRIVYAIGRRMQKIEEREGGEKR